MSAEVSNTWTQINSLFISSVQMVTILKPAMTLEGNIGKRAGKWPSSQLICISKQQQYWDVIILFCFRTLSFWYLVTHPLTCIVLHLVPMTVRKRVVFMKRVAMTTRKRRETMATTVRRVSLTTIVRSLSLVIPNSPSSATPPGKYLPNPPDQLRPIFTRPKIYPSQPHRYL